MAELGRMSMLHTTGLQKHISHAGIFNTFAKVSKHGTQHVKQQLNLYKAAKGNLMHRVSDS